MNQMMFGGRRCPKASVAVVANRDRRVKRWFSIAVLSVYSGPEEALLAWLVVLAQEFELAVGLNAEQRKAARGHVGNDENATAGIDGKRARMNAVCVGILDERGLAGLGIDGIHGDGVFTVCRSSAVAEVDIATIGVEVNGAGGLVIHMGRVFQGFFGEEWLRRNG
jgi:hypothetical protein